MPLEAFWFKTNHVPRAATVAGGAVEGGGGEGAGDLVGGVSAVLIRPPRQRAHSMRPPTTTAPTRGGTAEECSDTAACVSFAAGTAHRRAACTECEDERLQRPRRCVRPTASPHARHTHVHTHTHRRGRDEIQRVLLPPYPPTPPPSLSHLMRRHVLRAHSPQVPLGERRFAGAPRARAFGGAAFGGADDAGVPECQEATEALGLSSFGVLITGRLELRNERLMSP